MDWMGIVGSIRNTLVKHAPGICTGVGIGGMITTVIFAVKSTPKAVKLLDEKKEELKVDKLSIADTVKTTWKCYISTVVSGGLSIACILSANSLNGHRNAALATAYSISETAFKEYREKVIKTIGEKKEESIRDEIAYDQIERTSIKYNDVIVTGRGETLCLDTISGRYFKSDIEAIKKAQNEINRRLLDEMYISLNEFYDELDLEHIGIGDELGWNVEKDLLRIYFSAQLTPDGVPCMVINYEVAPNYNYY